MDYFTNMPNYYNNMYYPSSNIKNIRMPSPVADRFAPGGFILPFALGFATAPLILPPARPRPYPYQQYQPYTPDYYNYQVFK